MTNGGTESGAEGGKDRRQLMKLAGFDTLGLLKGFWPGLNHSAAGQNPEAEFVPDLDIALAARPDRAAIFPGDLTDVWRFDAGVFRRSSERGAVSDCENTFIHCDQTDRWTYIKFYNPKFIIRNLIGSYVMQNFM